MKREALAAAKAILADSKRAVSFSGAGLSAESGVPTFRDASSNALWRQYDPMTLASPQGFEADPKLVLDWYRWRRTCLAKAKPNPAHRALAAHPDITHITQNVDNLLERAGAAGAIHLHGEMVRDRCHAQCGYTRMVDLQESPEIGACPSCGARMRPDVVWFGEMLPERAWRDAEDQCRRCDVMLVIGTSAAVYPAAGLISIAHGAGAKIIVINTERSDAGMIADVELLGRAGDLVPELLGEPHAA